MKNALLQILIFGLMALSFVGCTQTPVEPEEPQGDPSVVVYECNERIFARTDAFKKIEAYVPQLEKMQVNVLWLMPIHPRGEYNAIGSPYCIKNHREIDPAFGTMDDLKSLVNTCHAHDIRVVLDWVANHTSWDNPWVSAHPDWYQSAQTADERLWNDVAFLNYSNQEVRDTMTACMLYWIEEADIDGFRCDYAHGVPTNWWKEATAAILEAKPNAFLLAETEKTELYTAGFQLLYSWSYLTAIENLYSGSGTIYKWMSASDAEFNSTPEGKGRLRYITTHDECNSKAPQSCYTNAKGELSAFCLTIFMGGVPMIYSSQEIGYMQQISFFDYKLLDFQSGGSTRAALETLMQAYQNTRLLRTGKKQAGQLSGKVAYVEYRRGEQSLLVVCNTTNSPQSVDLPAAYQQAKVTDMQTQEKRTLSSRLDLGAYEYVIYKR